MARWQDDQEYEAHRLDRVDIERYESGAEFYTLSHDGWCLAVEKRPEQTVAPREGMTARFYGGGIGRPVRGVVLVGEECPEGAVLYYRSATEEQAYWDAYLAEQDAKRRAEYQAKRGEYETRINALPPPFVERITGFLERRPDFGWQHLPYELFTCEEAVKIAAVYTDPAEIADFAALPTEAQVAMVPDLAMDQHSGNTFGMACRLAHIYRTDASLIPKAHGALCPLTGCETWGCWATTQPHEED